MDGAAATSRVHKILGTQPPAKRVRFNQQAAIRQIPSCKDADAARLDSALITPVPKVLAVTTDKEPTFWERPQSPPKEADFRGTLNTDAKPPNRERLFLRNFFQMVTDNSAVLRA